MNSIYYTQGYQDGFNGEPFNPPRNYAGKLNYKMGFEQARKDRGIR